MELNLSATEHESGLVAGSVGEPPNSANTLGSYYLWWSAFLIHPLITVLSCLVSVFVVLGNSLVVSAIWHENQLHLVTNYLIASLAVADCLVGLVVMPFSILPEIVLGYWSFGPIWCDLWHSFDVLASTASIMNLCAISLDRYLAITDPISYPARMTPKRVALLIVSLWTCSALISFPAIIWWRSVGKGPLQRIQLGPQQGIGQLAGSGSTEGASAATAIDVIASAATAAVTPVVAFSNRNHDKSASSLEHYNSIIDDYHSGAISSGSSSGGGEGELYKCVFTDDTYYLLFSSFVSFYGPLCVMLYAYYRIYKAAVKQTRFLKHGSKQVMVNCDSHNRSSQFGENTSNLDDYQPNTNLVLRAHRGGGASSSASQAKPSQTKQVSSATPSHENREPTGASESPNVSSANATSQVQPQNQQAVLFQFEPQSDSDLIGRAPESGQQLVQIDFYPERGSSSATAPSDTVVTLRRENSTTARTTVARTMSNKSSSTNMDNAPQPPLPQPVSVSIEPSPSIKQRKVGRKLSRLAKERKAAKTLGIVVGVFILCWLPFFVVNTIVALCGPRCIYKFDIVSAVVTWLGWLNSAMNPVIYACWSRDFRKAFRRVLLSWFLFLCPYKSDGNKLLLSSSDNNSSVGGGANQNGAANFPFVNNDSFFARKFSLNSSRKKKNKGGKLVAISNNSTRRQNSNYTSNQDFYIASATAKQGNKINNFKSSLKQQSVAHQHKIDSGNTVTVSLAGLSNNEYACNLTAQPTLMPEQQDGCQWQK